MSFPFTNEDGSRLRPALVVALCERHQDVLLALISSKLNGPPHDDELDLLSDQPDFEMRGLKVSSRLRLTRMTTLAIAQVPGVKPGIAMAATLTCIQENTGLATETPRRALPAAPQRPR